MYDTCYMANPIEEQRRQLVAENLRTLLEEKETNPSAVSKAIGMSHTTARNIILGNSKNPQFSTLQKIAAHLDVDVRRITVGPDFEQVEEAHARVLQILSQLSEDKRLKLEGFAEGLLAQ